MRDRQSRQCRMKGEDGSQSTKDRWGWIGEDIVAHELLCAMLPRGKCVPLMMLMMPTTFSGPKTLSRNVPDDELLNEQQRNTMAGETTHKCSVVNQFAQNCEMLRSCAAII